MCFKIERSLLQPAVYLFEKFRDDQLDIFLIILLTNSEQTVPLPKVVKVKRIKRTRG